MKAKSKAKTKSTPASPRLSVLIAHESRTAIILRRGPSKHVRMIVWDLASDTFVKGQWISGRVRSCDISPDGNLFVYFAAKHGTELGTFTAISRPPNFTALALWPDGMSWGGGGRFSSNKKVVLGYNCNPKELNDGTTIPTDFEVSDSHHSGQSAFAKARTPWIQTATSSLEKRHKSESMRVVFDEPWVYQRPNPVDSRVVLERTWVGWDELNGRSSVDHYRVLFSQKTDDPNPQIEELGAPDWVDWDHDGSLLLSRDGCLFRASGPHSHRKQDLIQIADLGDDVFKNILPTNDARTWP